MRSKIGCRVVMLGLAALAAGVLARQAAGAGSTPRIPVATGDWPMYGHDVARTNYNPDETTISAGNASQLVQRWQANIGTNGTPSSSGPIVSNGRVFVGSSASSGDNYFAFDALSGAPAWSVPLSYTADCEQVGIGATAAISGTTLVVGGGDAAYYGLDTATGAQLWRNALNVGPSGFAWASPLLAHGRAYLGIASYCDNPSVRGEVRAVADGTGAAQARTYIMLPGEEGGGIWNSPVLSPDGSVLIVATGEDYNCTDCSLTRSMVSIDPLSMAVLQHHQEPAPNDDEDFATTPIIFHDRLGRALVGANHKDGTFYAYAINNISAGAVWSLPIGDAVGAMPAYDPTDGSGGTLFVEGGGAQLYAVDPADGSYRWANNSVTTSYYGNIAVANGLLFINTGSGGVEIRREADGSLLRTLVPPNSGDTFSGIAVANGAIYWVAGGYLNAWSLPVTGQLVGHLTWQGRPAQPSALQQLPVTLTLSLAGTQYNYPNLTTDASGFFTVSVATLPAGTYQWRAKGPQFLATAGTVALTNSPRTAVELGLQRTGDVNNDNAVDIADFSLLRATFGRACGDGGYDGRADLTGDCSVDVSDFSWLRANFGQAGASAPESHPTLSWRQPIDSLSSASLWAARRAQSPGSPPAAPAARSPQPPS